MDNLKDKKKEILSKTLNNIKLQDAGIKRNKAGIPTISSNKGVEYPSLYLNTEEVPQLKGYEVSDKVIFIMEAEIVSHNKNENMTSSRENFDLKLKKIGCKNKGE